MPYPHVVFDTERMVSGHLRRADKRMESPPIVNRLIRFSASRSNPLTIILPTDSNVSDVRFPKSETLDSIPKDRVKLAQR
ncbi:MAG: hypothetical protein HY867_17545 [Chloroflexi bacterium]|nr:hypothetical protein [Chloroflexota bacterium]